MNRKYNNEKTARMTMQAMLMAIMLVMGFTPLGSIPLPFMKATTTHIPVIIAAILFGVKSGAAFGVGFGIVSMVRQTIMPNITAFAFTPFIPIPGTEGFNWRGLIVAFVPRIMIGVTVALLYRFLARHKVNDKINLMICSITGSMVNTVFVLGLIYLLMGNAYAAAQGISHEALLGLLSGVIFSNGIGEAIVAALLVTAIITALMKAFPKLKNMAQS